MAKLTLAAKKNIRDNEAALKESAAKLDHFAGGPVTVEVDHARFNEVLGKDASYADRSGEAVQWIVDGMAGKWDYLFKDNAIFKAALAKAWTTKKIIVKPDSYTRPSGASYHSVTLEGGSIVIGCDPTLICSNCGDIGEDSLTALGLKSDEGYSLKLAINVNENRPKIAEFEKEISASTGVSGVHFAVDFGKLDEWIRALPDGYGSGYEDRSAEVAVWLIEGLAGNLKRIAADDLSKEAIQESWKGEIVVAPPNPKLEDYHVTELKDGKMILHTRSPTSNVSYAGADIDKRL